MIKKIKDWIVPEEQFKIGETVVIEIELYRIDKTIKVYFIGELISVDLKLGNCTIRVDEIISEDTLIFNEEIIEQEGEFPLKKLRKYWPGTFKVLRKI